MRLKALFPDRDSACRILTALLTNIRSRCDYADVRLMGTTACRTQAVNGSLQPLQACRVQAGAYWRALAGGRGAAFYSPCDFAPGDRSALLASLEAGGEAVLSVLRTSPPAALASAPYRRRAGQVTVWDEGPGEDGPGEDGPGLEGQLPAICRRAAELSRGAGAGRASGGTLDVETTCIVDDSWILHADTGGGVAYSRTPWLHVLHGASAGAAYAGRAAGGRTVEAAFSAANVRRLRSAEALAGQLAAAERLEGRADYDYLLLDHDILGLVVHEAVGHALEGDHVAAGSSAVRAAGQVLWRSDLPFDIVASPTLPNCGYHPVDGEGTAGREVVLVEDGCVKACLHTLETAAELGQQANGHGFSADWWQPVLSRMTSIHLRPQGVLPELPRGWDETTLADVLCDRGILRPGGRAIYLTGWDGGHATWSNLSFRANVAAAYVLEPGQKPHLYRQGLLTGDAAAMLGSLVYAFGPVLVDTAGYCWKEGQSVLTSDGGPVITVFRRTEGVALIG